MKAFRGIACTSTLLSDTASSGCIVRNVTELRDNLSKPSTPHIIYLGQWGSSTRCLALYSSISVDCRAQKRTEQECEEATVLTTTTALLLLLRLCLDSRTLAFFRVLSSCIWIESPVCISPLDQEAFRSISFLRNQTRHQWSACQDCSLSLSPLDQMASRVTSLLQGQEAVSVAFGLRLTWDTKYLILREIHSFY